MDYIACSFVSCRRDLADVKAYLQEIGGEGIDLIAKIENRAGVENIEDICAECEGIMIGAAIWAWKFPTKSCPRYKKD